MTKRNDDTVTLDVRPEIRAGREPFGRIMETVSRLKDGERLRLFAPFEPVPLFGVLAQQGFAHEARRTASGDWEVIFSRSAGATRVPAKTPAASPSPCCCSSPVDVDARGLEPPQPLVVILEALTQLPPGRVLRARTDRRPLHLYAQLEERGFTGRTEEQSDGSFVTTIQHI